MPDSRDPRFVANIGRLSFSSQLTAPKEGVDIDFMQSNVIKPLDVLAGRIQGVLQIPARNTPSYQSVKERIDTCREDINEALGEAEESENQSQPFSITTVS